MGHENNVYSCKFKALNRKVISAFCAKLVRCIQLAAQNVYQEIIFHKCLQIQLPRL